MQYLNARPLIVPYDGEVVFEHPARLADLLAAGEIDVALIPVFEALRQPEFPIVDGVAIASRGPVYSVFLAYRGPVKEVRTICARPRFAYLEQPCALPSGGVPRAGPGLRAMRGKRGSMDDHGLLLIGNQAIRFREQPREGVSYLDFGEEWLARTGLPFVYAVWQIRREVADAGAVADALRAVKVAGAEAGAGDRAAPAGLRSGVCGAVPDEPHPV